MSETVIVDASKTIAFGAVATGNMNAYELVRAADMIWNDSNIEIEELEVELE